MAPSYKYQKGNRKPMAIKNGDYKIRCSFCGKTEDQVRKLIAGPDGSYICDECVEICSEIIEEEVSRDRMSGSDINLMTPMEMKEVLDEYVVGQDEAKKVLAVSVYNHYKRILSGRKNDVELQKSNILMLGPTGSGKTFLAQNLARMLNVPFAIADATTLTEAGYVGEDVENILLKIIQAADYDIERAQQGIIYIDATNILFICGGAFEGLEKIIEGRMDTKTIGFNGSLGMKHEKNVGEILKEVMPQDFIKFGLIPEFIGRVPVVVSLDALDEDALVRILQEPKNSLVKQYKALMDMDGVDLEFEPDALREVAKTAMERKTGARGLRSVIEKTMMDVMYEAPSNENMKKCVITKDAVTGKGKPVVTIEENPEKKPARSSKRRGAKRPGRPETA